MQLHSRPYPPEHPRRQRHRAMFLALDAQNVRVTFEVLDRTCWGRSCLLEPRRRPATRPGAAEEQDFREFVLSLVGTSPAMPSTLERMRGILDWDVETDVFAIEIRDGGPGEMPAASGSSDGSFVRLR